MAIDLPVYAEEQELLLDEIRAGESPFLLPGVFYIH
jgi:hypothetical protein